MIRYLSLFYNLIDKSYNYGVFKTIRLVKLFGVELIMAKAKNKQRGEKLKKGVIKINNLNKLNRLNHFWESFIYK